VVDNGSSDGSAEYVRQEFPEANLLALPDNLGFAGGNIAGYEKGSGSLIVLLNNDTEAHPEWLQEMNKAAISYPRAGSFASRMMYFDERNRIENCGFELGPEGATLDVGRHEVDGPAWSEPRRVLGGGGGAVV
jgi:GT2 family glycosyltransferase